MLALLVRCFSVGFFIHVEVITASRWPQPHPRALKTLPLLHPLREASSSYTGYLMGKGMRKSLSSPLVPQQSTKREIDHVQSNVRAGGSIKRVLACVGDSSAFAIGLRLQADLGSEWDVQLYWEGCASAFMTRQHDRSCGGQPFLQSVGFSSARLSAADFVLITLGTSDSGHNNGGDFDEQGFIWGYQNLVMDFQRMVTSPQVVIVSPPPLYRVQNMTGNPNMTVVNEIYPRIFPQIANTTGTRYLDGFSACGGHSNESMSSPNCSSESGQLSREGACHLALLFEEKVLGLSSLGHCQQNATLPALGSSLRQPNFQSLH
eukprot:gnl/MRDRNA2_/MRDRNA2_106588_c0_seq1.p1 gnl/MRDRNA2_/MRDRNA2_106588_c0~~gnl/MRDRNA2_/MRDRNA2_106588_c0_seq1.p1  ORF type:complete len:319 (-),score=37.31 gnl/MRDRNA2_/MRDRNA2_106588_c0_seq1:92-1048(-)